MVNSATALALRPGVLTTVMPRSRAAAMSILTGPPRDTATSFSFGRRSHHAGGKRRELRHEDLGVADEVDDLVGLAHIFLQPVHAGLGVAVLHRLVRPGQFDARGCRAPSPQRFADRRPKHLGEHEAVADDGDLTAHCHGSCRACGHGAPDRPQRLVRLAIDREELVVESRERGRAARPSPSSGVDPVGGAGVHVGIDARCDTAAIIAAPAAPASSRCHVRTSAPSAAPRICAQRLGARRAAGQRAPRAGSGAHRRVAIARGEGQAFEDRAHQVGIADAGVESPTNCARARWLDEGPALAGLRNVGMVEQRRPGGGQRSVRRAARAARRAMRSTPCALQDARGEVEQPVDVERRRHVRLHLRIHAGHGKGHRVAGRFGVERHVVGRRREAHVHAGRADDGAAGLAARGRRGRRRAPVQTTST